MDPSPPNCNYETFTINVSSNVSSNNSTFKTLIVNPVKDVVEFSLIHTPPGTPIKSYNQSL